MDEWIVILAMFIGINFVIIRYICFAICKDPIDDQIEYKQVNKKPYYRSNMNVNNV